MHTMILGRNINNLRYADNTTLMPGSEEELKSLLMKVKEESEKADLKLNIQKPKIVASSPIKQMGKQWKQWDTIFGGSRITAAMVTAATNLKNTCSLEEKLWPT